MDTKVHLAQALETAQTGKSPAHCNEVEIDCYDNAVPEFIGRETDRLYSHLCCSLSYFELASELTDASTFVLREGGTPICILLYKKSGQNITVISDYVGLHEGEINRFAEYMFRRFSSVKRISFRKLRADIHHLTYPCHAMICGEDMVVKLPSTVQEYEAAVGKNMRRNIKRYTNALIKDFPSYRYQLYLNEQVNEQDIRDIIALSCMRMKSKNIVPRFDEKETQWIIDFAKQCGIVGVVIIDGRICAGAIGFRIGDNYFMHVIAHDLKYNGYSLGILCYYHTICEGIARGGKHFHLLQGRYGYKYRLLAEKQDVIHVDIYRSRMHALRYSSSILKKEIKGRIWLAKQWLLHDVERQEGKAYRLLGSMVRYLRNRKRAKGLAGGEEVY